VTVDRTRKDLADLRRHTLIWIGALLWLGAGYALQDPAKDPYDAAERAAFSYAMLVVIPLITAVFVFAWVNVLRRPRA
jgi:heme/copper-type cytochrome/quinol oxidase subunit 2